MAFSKASLYPKEDQILSAFFAAMSHPARIGILRKLARLKSSTVENLSQNHPIAQPTFSEHLACLREVHLVLHKEKFPYTYYSTNGKSITMMIKIIEDFLKEL